ncbi:hypothetical protein HMPREF2660_01320 [Weeksella sp. HMSC059D05]|mgnify:CR=1 FL=1|uniref:Uncharacterized protein n=2 Tax=Weeksellaceae TaxID=2762318 RepID=F0NYG9_WEEVC|nr:hypothetical protein [Weeksella virosa]OFM83468.1 hypothetical protein HMPREF2660_01320 [Weeksella sp. HMSC059D05]ADX67089.1 hypothetical protein Weevi_0369 [Weeksella virosa DSM 16922]MDK7675016.1 hypothetical protein [Weeksella virosa]SUP53359.1 Uncharacterised protein [Weeksella virosa]VEH63175.1 Uncharacterised protein [Weeksella virosa]
MAFRPILPMIEYVLQYDKIVREYCINTERPELMCNGKCYLSEKLEESFATDKENNKKVNPKLNSADGFVLMVEKKEIIILPITQNRKIFFYTIIHYSDSHVRQVWQPPIIV